VQHEPTSIGPCAQSAEKDAEGFPAKDDMLFWPRRISGGNEWYLRQNLLVAEDFIERLYSSGVDVFHRFLPEMIESSRLRIGLNLAIPSIVKIDLGQTLEKLGLVSLGQLLHRFDDFTHGAHTSNLTETLSKDQPSPAATGLASQPS